MAGRIEIGTNEAPAVRVIPTNEPNGRKGRRVLINGLSSSEEIIRGLEQTSHGRIKSDEIFQAEKDFKGFLMDEIPGPELLNRWGRKGKGSRNLKPWCLAEGKFIRLGLTEASADSLVRRIAEEIYPSTTPDASERIDWKKLLHPIELA